MVSFDFSFRLMLIEEIIEDEGVLWTEGSISQKSFNVGYYHGKMIQFVNGAFFLALV